MRALCTVVACRTLGDETTYNKFLARQCAQGDTSALQLMQGVDFINQIHTDMNSIIQNLQLGGHERVAHVMRALRDVSICNFGRVDMCAVCSLTGRCGSSFVVLHTAEYGMLIDIKYKKLLHCIWVMWHIVNIETSRVEQSKVFNSSISISSCVHEFLHDSAITDEEIMCYYSAYTLIQTTFNNLLSAS